MGLKRVSWVGRYQGQCRRLRPLGHRGYRLRSYKKDPPLCSGYTEEMAIPLTRAHTAPEPSLEHNAEALERPARARTAPVARHTEPKRDNMGDTPMAEESEAPGTVG